VRVIIIDDDPLVARALVRALGWGGFEGVLAEVADLGPDAPPPDAVIVELDLYRRPCGDLVLRAVAQHYPRCARILTSGALDPWEATQLVASGVAHRVLRKPWTIDEVRAVVKAAIAAARR